MSQGRILSHIKSQPQEESIETKIETKKELTDEAAEQTATFLGILDLSKIEIIDDYKVCPESKQAKPTKSNPPPSPVNLSSIAEQSDRPPQSPRLGSKK